MALSDLEKKRVERALSDFMKKRRPPPEIRKQVDFGYQISGQSVELFEIRPQWDNPEVMLHHPFAKATYVRPRNVWKVFWMMADLKWHAYPPVKEVGQIEQFFAIVDEDANCCFSG